MTVARTASGDFSRGLRVYHFGSALWAPRVQGFLARWCDRGSWEGRSGAFLEPSVVGLSPPPSGPGCAVSALAVPPFAARGYPCTARAARALLALFRHLRISLRHQGLRFPGVPHNLHSGSMIALAPCSCLPSLSNACGPVI